MLKMIYVLSLICCMVLDLLMFLRSRLYSFGFRIRLRAFVVLIVVLLTLSLLIELVCWFTFILVSINKIIIQNLTNRCTGRHTSTSFHGKRIFINKKPIIILKSTNNKTKILLKTCHLFFNYFQLSISLWTNSHCFSLTISSQNLLWLTKNQFFFK
jgi:hypothetical protein